MDYAKLTNLNGIYIRKADDDRLTHEVLQRLAHRKDLSLGSIAAGRIRALMPHLKERAKTLIELADSAAFLAQVVPLAMEPKARGMLTAEARLLLQEEVDVLAATDFSEAGIDAALRAFAEQRGQKLGQIVQPLRAALTGSTVSPGIGATGAALGRDEAMARIEGAIGPTRKR